MGWWGREREKKNECMSIIYPLVSSKVVTTARQSQVDQLNPRALSGSTVREAVAQELRPSVSEWMPWGNKLLFTQNTSIAGSSFTHYATMPDPQHSNFWG